MRHHDTASPAALADWMSALAGHLQKHQHLAPWSTTVRPGDREVQLHPHGTRGEHQHLLVLLGWADTLTSTPAPTIRVTHTTADGALHLVLTGRLAGGEPVEIVCLPKAASAVALAALTSIFVGATIPVEVVRRLLGEACVTGLAAQVSDPPVVASAAVHDTPGEATAGAVPVRSGTTVVTTQYYDEDSGGEEEALIAESAAFDALWAAAGWVPRGGLAAQGQAAATVVTRSAATTVVAP